ncbi:MAG: 4-hydroxy-tetrahydrodipicolinate reductase [Bowdeniella nasicola]|nr:4-hydroxy-tetrahydrodipicolinate reductase [Bowdeniella nasicola]
MRIAVTGAKGRMGQAVCAAVTAAGHDLVATIDADDPFDLNGADVLIDFTVPSQTLTNVCQGLASGAHVVVGTSGWDDQMLARVRQAQAEGNTNVLIAPNFSLAAVFMMRFAEMAAPYFTSVEVVEMHHPDKVDAPSGTATATAQRIAAARASTPAMPDATQTDPQGTRGGTICDIPVHALRLRGATAHQEVLLGNAGELLTIRADSFDRESFMPGVLLAIDAIANLPGVTIGLEHALQLED